MDIRNSKVKALTKEETKTLMSLIQNSKIINNKTTNAITNKLKTEEWNRITEEFNACISTGRRTAQQLRLKWENLKKNARKRSTMIRMNQMKTGGGVPEYIPPDEILDMVSSLLGSTVEGFTVEFGGDAEVIDLDSGATVTLLDRPDPIEEELEVSGIPGTLPDDMSGQVIIEEKNDSIIMTPPISKKLFFPAPRASGSKRRFEKRKDDDGRKERNLAMAAYFTSKKKYLDENLHNIVLQNEKLKLEIEQLKNKLPNN